MLMFKDIITFLAINYRDTSLLPLFRIMLTYKKLVVKKNKKSACFKWTYILSGNDYRVAALSKSYLTVIRIIMKSTGIILTCLN